MSIRIGHGYRVHTDDIDAFLVLVADTLGPVRNDLDAALYAELAAGAHDRALLSKRDYSEPTLREEAHALFMADVTDGHPGTVFHHPHSLDLAYAHPDAAPDGPWYVLLHCQRGAYHDAFRTLPGVEPYEYWNHSDSLPDGVTEKDWKRRRVDWQWLLDAPTIGAVMQRWTHRADPALDLAHATAPDVFAAHLPTREGRAKDIARDLTCAELLARIENPQWEDVHDVLFDEARRSRSAALIPHIATQLPILDHSALDRGQPDPITLDIPTPAQ